jgi:hypothetical protein
MVLRLLIALATEGAAAQSRRHIPTEQLGSGARIGWARQALQEDRAMAQPAPA